MSELSRRDLVGDDAAAFLLVLEPGADRVHPPGCGPGETLFIVEPS